VRCFDRRAESPEKGRRGSILYCAKSVAVGGKGSLAAMQKGDGLAEIGHSVIRELNVASPSGRKSDELCPASNSGISSH
jgi:hypothetical protein